MLIHWRVSREKNPTEVSFGILVFFFVCSAEATEIMRPLVFTILQESEVPVPDVFSFVSLLLAEKYTSVIGCLVYQVSFRCCVGKKIDVFLRLGGI